MPLDTPAALFSLSYTAPCALFILALGHGVGAWQRSYLYPLLSVAAFLPLIAGPVITEIGSACIAVVTTGDVSNPPRPLALLAGALLMLATTLWVLLAGLVLHERTRKRGAPPARP